MGKPHPTTTFLKNLEKKNPSIEAILTLNTGGNIYDR
jgi:hypothetical protein